MSTGRIRRRGRLFRLFLREGLNGVVENLDGYRGSPGDPGHVLGKDDDAVRHDHGLEDSRPLFPRRHDGVFPLFLPDDAPEEVTQARLLFDFFLQGRLDRFPEKSGVSRHLADSGADELLEGDHGRHRVPGKAEDRFSPHGPEDQGPSRPHGHFPELDIRTEVLDHVLDEIVIPHGNPGGRNDDVRPKGCLVFFLEVVHPVPGDPDVERDAARFDNLGGQGIAVAAHDDRRRNETIHLHEFVPGGQDGHERLLVNGHERAAQGREHADFCRADPLAPGKDQLAQPDVLSRVADVFALLDGNEKGENVRYAGEDVRDRKAHV